MVGQNREKNQQSLFSPGLKVMLNPKNPLYQLSGQIDWAFFEEEFEKFYIDFGRPSKPIRLMVSLLILKQVYSLSDERVVEEWVQNPYYQYFSGMETFQWQFPCTPSELTHFRNRIGQEGAELILKNSIELHGKSSREKEVLIDSTVQEKNITYPTDIKLYRKIIEKCRKIANETDIELRQSYKFTLPKLIMDQRFKNHPRSRHKAKKSEKKIKTIAGRILRDVMRKVDKETMNQYQAFFINAEIIMNQKRSDKNKLYSLHETNVYCISKGKSHKKYEFGTKASIVKTKKSGIIVGAMNIHKQYDGNSLPEVLQQVERLTGHKPKVGIVDRGYRGKKIINGTEIMRPSVPSQKTSNYQKRKQRLRFRARAGIEPIIGHIKQDHRMARNYLKGVIGDDINIFLSAAAFNYKKMLNRLKFNFCLILSDFKERLFAIKSTILNRNCDYFGSISNNYVHVSCLYCTL